VADSLSDQTRVGDLCQWRTAVAPHRSDGIPFFAADWLVREARTDS
jgi:hypothetical protein